MEILSEKDDFEHQCESYTSINGQQPEKAVVKRIQ